MSDDYYGSNHKWFVGVCEERVDEAYIRVRVWGIHPIDKTAVPTEDLPLALVVYPVTGDQTRGGTATHNIDIDSWVVGFWVDYPICQQPMVTGVIQGTDYSMSQYPSGGGEFVGDGGDEETPPSENGEEPPTGSGTKLTGSTNRQKVYNYVYDKLQMEGDTNIHVHTSALVGVLMLESSPSINPAIEGGYMGRAWGICQWLGGRRSQLFRKYGRTKSLSNQLDFMWWELNNTEKSAKNRWLSSSNLPDAVAGFSSFERAEEWQGGRINRGHKNYKSRLRYAYQVYNQMSKGDAT